MREAQTPSKSLLSGEFKEIPLNQIDPPKEPVRRVDTYISEEIGLSIQNDGLYGPLIVRPKVNGRFEVVAGNHRYDSIMRTFREQGDMKTPAPRVPCIVRELNDQESQLVSIAENIQRNTHLDPLREGEIFSGMVHKEGWSPAAIQHRIGKKRIDYVTNRILVFEKLHEVLKARMRSRSLPMRIAVDLAGQPLDEQLKYYTRIMKSKKKSSEGCSHGCPAHCPEYEA